MGLVGKSSARRSASRRSRSCTTRGSTSSPCSLIWQSAGSARRDGGGLSRRKCKSNYADPHMCCTSRTSSVSCIASVGTLLLRGTRGGLLLAVLASTVDTTPNRPTPGGGPPLGVTASGSLPVMPVAVRGTSPVSHWGPKGKVAAYEMAFALHQFVPHPGWVGGIGVHSKVNNWTVLAKFLELFLHDRKGPLQLTLRESKRFTVSQNRSTKEHTFKVQVTCTTVVSC